MHQLRIYLKVVERQSITKAADELYLTQPAVSIQLKKFQEQFSVPLTEVVGKKLYVTDFGKEVAAHAQKILEDIEALDYKTKSFKGQLAGKMRVSVVSTGKYVMPFFLSDFLRQNSAVDLVMDVTNKTQVVKSLEHNEVDFSLVSTIPEQLSLHTIQLMSNKLYLVGGTCINRNPNLPIKKIFERYPLLFREEGSATRLSMEKFIAEKSLPTFKKIELTSNEAVKQALIAGLGYSIMPLIGIKNELKNNDLEIVPFRGLPIISYWHLIWLKAKKMSPIADAYLKFIKAEKDRIIKDSFGWYERYNK